MNLGEVGGSWWDSATSLQQQLQGHPERASVELALSEYKEARHRVSSSVLFLLSDSCQREFVHCSVHQSSTRGPWCLLLSGHCLPSTAAHPLSVLHVVSHHLPREAFSEHTPRMITTPPQSVLTHPVSLLSLPCALCSAWPSKQAQVHKPV